MKKLLAILLTGILLSGCIVSDTQMEKTTTQTGIKLEGKIKELIILNDHKINSKLTVELIKRGFKVKPFVSQQKVTEKSSTGEIEYNEAAARYGLKIESENKGWKCVFSMNEVDEFTFTLIDLRTNDIIDIFEKKGPTGKCPPLTPIYILYADYLTIY
ncbi:hypothetical protein OAR85_00460 [Candidatus Pelagibacter sp.]|nr:hypothetical protein [Candidatus Pelagibacter sp.]